MAVPRLRSSPKNKIWTRIPYNNGAKKRDFRTTQIPRVHRITEIVSFYYFMDEDGLTIKLNSYSSPRTYCVVNRTGQPLWCDAM